MVPKDQQQLKSNVLHRIYFNYYLFNNYYFMRKVSGAHLMSTVSETYFERKVSGSNFKRKVSDAHFERKVSDTNFKRKVFGTHFKRKVSGIHLMEIQETFLVPI